MKFITQLTMVSFIYLVLMVNVNNFCYCIELLEFILGPKLGEKSASVIQPSPVKDVDIRVKKFGYHFETHQILSETGYYLTLHRIPKGRKQKPQKLQRNVVLIHHGFLGSSDMFLLRGPEKDLPYLLVDAGYDVWLCNARGNVYSRKHHTLDPNKDAEYWNFGVQELGYYDLADTIDYILAITNQTDLFFINYSLGSSVGLVLCSLRPEYNSKIRLFLALAPVSYVKHSLTPLHDAAFNLINIFGQSVSGKNIQEIFPRRTYISKLIEIFCGDRMPTQKLCLQFMSVSFGVLSEQFNTTFVPEIVRHFPAGTSLRLIANVAQYYLTGNFAHYDFGSKLLNILHYNSSLPPIYDLSKVTTPVSLHYGPGDIIVQAKDIEYLATQLPNVVGIFRIPHKHFNHMDFVYAVDGKSLLYDQLIELIKKYS